VKEGLFLGTVNPLHTAQRRKYIGEVFRYTLSKKNKDLNPSITPNPIENADEIYRKLLLRHTHKEGHIGGIHVKQRCGLLGATPLL
jgi:hypothetical protein